MKDPKVNKHTVPLKNENLNQKLDVLLMNYHLFNLDVMEFIYKIIEEDRVAEFDLKPDEFLKIFRSKMTAIRQHLVAMEGKPFTNHTMRLIESGIDEKTNNTANQSPGEVLNVFSIMMDLQKDLLSLFPVVADKQIKKAG